MKNLISLDDACTSEDTTLLCPHCDFYYLHHGEVTVFYRKREDQEVYVTRVDGRQGRPSTSNRRPRHAPPASAVTALPSSSGAKGAATILS